MKTIALILFILTYVCLLIFSKYRAYIALGSAVIFVVLGLAGILPRIDVLAAIDWNVILMTGKSSYGYNRDRTSPGELYRFFVELCQITIKGAGHGVFGRNLIHTVRYYTQSIAI